MTTDTPHLPVVEPPAASRTTVRAWLALGTMTLTSLSLVSAEFLPGGIVTTMAADLGVTAGQAGQTITVTALIGFVAALLIGVVTPGVDRRTLLTVLAIAAAASNVLVAIAPSLWLLLIARLLLGAALSGFWSMSLTVAARIGGQAHIARSMTIVNAGTTLATVAGVPIGVFASALVGWRTVFVVAGVVTLLAALALRTLLPAVPAERGATLASLGRTALVRGMRQGLAGHVLVVLGHMAAYSFVRVTLERMPGLDAAGIAGMLVLFGAGGFAGNLVLGAFAERHLGTLRLAVPVAMGAAILVIALSPASPVLVGVAIVVWGATFGGWLVVLNTWVGTQVPDRLEAGGGLAVAAFQLAIALGAAMGGVLVDALGVGVEATVAGVLVLVGAALFGTAPRAGERLGR